MGIGHFRTSLVKLCGFRLIYSAESHLYALGGQKKNYSEKNNYIMTQNDIPVHNN